MIEGRIVTDQQALDLQNVFFDSDTFFNFVQDINDVYFQYVKFWVLSQLISHL